MAAVNVSTLQGDLNLSPSSISGKVLKKGQ